MKSSLSWKINSIIIAVVSLIFLGSGGYNITQSWQRLVTELETDATILANRLSRSLIGPMWAFDDDIIWDFMESEMQDPDVVAIVVGRPNGNITTFITTRNEDWQVERLTTPQAIEGFIQKHNEIIRNDETLGQVTIFMTDRFINQTYHAEVTNLLIQTGILLTAIIVTLFLLIQQVVVRPVATLTRSSKIIADGNLDEQIPVQRTDEIGVLANSFKAMQSAIKQQLTTLNDEIVERKRAESEVRELNETLEQRVIARTQRLAATASLSEQLNALLDFDQMLQLLVNQVKVQFDYYHVHIYLLEASSTGPTLVMAEGTGRAGVEMKRQGHVIPLDHSTSLVAQAARTGKVVTVDHVHETANWLANPLLPDTEAEMAVPIIREGHVVGVLDVQSDKVAGLDEGDANLLRSLAGHVAVALINARLFAETKQAQAIAESAREKADLANQAKSDFLSNMSHELRTPLNGILGYAQILQRKHNLAPDMLDGLNIIQHSGQHLLTLINDILDLSKIEAGKMELYPKPTHLSNFVEGIIGMMYMKAKEKGLTFQHELNHLPDGVAIDEKRLRQILLNLSGNAVKFTDNGQVTLRVTGLGQPLSIDSHVAQTIAGADFVATYQQLFRFEVIDTGVGMSPEELTKIFEAFEQVGDEDKRAEGTGLGLAITKQLVELMGGSLQVKSALGQGTTFWFEVMLPLTEVNEPTIQNNLGQQIVGYEGRRRKLLIVEDNVNNRLVLLSLLKSLGFEVAEAIDGEAGLAQAKAINPDLIITDLVMPRMDGAKLIEAIRDTPTIAKLPILMVSASSFEGSERTKAINQSDGFLTKPIDINQLLTLISKHLELGWIYEETEPDLDTTSPSATLIVPPVEMLVELHHFAQIGSMKRIKRWTRQIVKMDEQYRPFTETVNAFVKIYDSDGIIKLVEPYLPHQTKPPFP